MLLLMYFMISLEISNAFFEGLVVFTELALVEDFVGVVVKIVGHQFNVP